MANLIRPMNRHRDCLYWNAGETDATILMKLEIAKYLKKNGLEFYSECIFENGSRADFLVADGQFIIEVLDSEKPENIIEKQKRYPLPIRSVNANQKFTEKLIQ